MRFHFSKKSCFILLFIAFVFVAKSQNINNLKVYVSSESLTVLKFNSRISHVDFGNKDDYTSQVRDDDNSLVIKTVGDSASNTNLYVNEGKRGHLFNIVYLPVIDINNTRLFYDFSDLKRLKKLVEDPNQYTAQSTSYNRATEESEEDKKAQYSKDSAVAAEAKKKADIEAARIAKNKADSIQQRKEEDAKLAKAKADAEAAQKAEELRLAKAQADAQAKQKSRGTRVGKSKGRCRSGAASRRTKISERKSCG